jgi:hypothetical protein
MPLDFSRDAIKKLLQEKPWTENTDYFNKQTVFKPKILHTVSIQSETWKQFCIDHYDLGDHMWEQSQDYYSDETVKMINDNLSIGRHKYNTYAINYGKQPQASSLLKKLLGDDNIKKMNLNPDYLLVRLILKLPGQGVAWHVDEANTFFKKFPDLKADNNYKTQYGQTVRYWFPVTDWEDGHMFQISKTILWDYKQGQVFQIPFGIGHASANAGFSPFYSVAITGIINN